MSNQRNRQWLIVKRPEGMPGPENFEYRETEIPTPGEGEILIRILIAIMDPAQRGWMDPAGNYFEPMPLGEPVRSVTIAQVVESNSDMHPVGQIVSGLGGWADYAVVPAGSVAPVPVEWGHDLSAYAHVFGAVGATAYYGLFEVCDLKDGENVLVSGAAGGVGSLVGQFAKIKGCKVVGIAGGPEKCNWLTEELGFDSAIDYRSVDGLSDAIGEQFPDGLDVYFDNVGGETLEAAMDHLALGARIGICGMISEYNQTHDPEPGPKNMWNLLVKRARIEGLLVADYMHRAQDGYEQINEWLKEGKVKYKVDIRDSFEDIPETFNCLFDGSHDGKLMVKLADPA